MSYTLQDVLDTNPCWGEARIRRAMQGRETFTVDELLDAEHVNATDRAWLALHLVTGLALPIAQYGAEYPHVASKDKFLLEMALIYAESEIQEGMCDRAVEYACLVLHCIPGPLVVAKIKEMTNGS